MPLNDVAVVRSALYPKILDDAELFSPQLVVSPFSPATLVDGSSGYALSVGAKGMLPTEGAVHDFGCRVAASANQRREADSPVPLVRGVNTLHYRGSYEIAIEAIIGIENEAFNVGVEPCPENGLDEHCHIELAAKDATMSKTKLGKARTGVIAKLYRLLRNPLEHVCDCDADLRELLEAIRLPEIKPAEEVQPAA